MENDTLLKACDIGDKLFNKWQNNKRNKNYETEYKKFRNLVNKKLNRAKNNYNRIRLLQNKNNVRVTWQIINEITGKEYNNLDTTIIKNFKTDNIQEISNKFAVNFYSNVQKIIHKCDIQTLRYEKQTIPNTIYLSPATEEEIFSILKNINVKKGPGIDNIRPKDIKNNAECLTPIITTFVNSSINNITIPKILKTSVIRPIYKNGTKNDYNNYRPIAILPIIEKVLEHVIVTRLNEFLEKYKIINPNQYGFQKGKNINKLLGNFANHINKQLSENKHCLALFVDFSKAFDTLSHKNLLEILERYGIRGTCLQWIKHYLELRCYRVKVGDCLSDETPSGNNGVPQGSKLGPVLYLIYANDMLNILHNSTVFAYADDTAIVVSKNNIIEASETMQNELNIVTRWCHDNGLIINATKTKLMHIKAPHLVNHEINLIFHNNQCLHNSKPHTVNMCNVLIEKVKTFKYLGVYVDDNFKWLSHIQNLRKKLRKTAYSLFHLSNCSPFDVLKQAYFSLTESYMRHGITAWGSSTYCKSLQQTQNQILKILLKNLNNNQQIQHRLTTVTMQTIPVTILSTTTQITIDFTIIHKALTTQTTPI